jgi:ribosome-binding factor A
VISSAIQKKLSDPRLERMASITRVEVTDDLSFADVSISVMGTESQQRAYMRAMNNAHGVLQRLVARNLRTRTCPTLRFHLDQSIKKGFETLQLIEKSQAERAEREGGAPGPAEADGTPDNHIPEEQE